MIIDVHQHVYWHGRNEDGLVQDMDAHGIRVAWLLSWEIQPSEHGGSWHGVLNAEHARPDGTHPGMPLSDLLRARSRYPDRFVVGFAPHTAFDNAAARFESAYHMHGVRVCGEWKARMLFDDPRCLELFRKAGELGCPVVLHLDKPYLIDAQTSRPVYQPNWYGGTVQNLERALQACPKTNFIGHAPGFWCEISGDADSDREPYPGGPVTPGGRLHKLFDAYPNLHADLSAGSAMRAMRRDIEHARVFLTRYEDRLLFGRDFYGGDLQKFLATLRLPRKTQTKIFSQNALRLVPSSQPRKAAVRRRAK
jgi:predicted TIM-barrel fold metal-dependent hydrolase